MAMGLKVNIHRHRVSFLAPTGAQEMQMSVRVKLV